MPGLSWASHKIFFLAWTFTAVSVGAALYFRNLEKEAEYQQKRKFWMHSGHYKHPWEQPTQPYNDPRAVEKIKGTDYVEFSKFPKGF